ncbi:MAG TPA: hypothetical protein VHB51_02395 [Candidatus Saccharimonadales bacterium]|nr:hypothetical protein [Candidatus Saccharimonadales bacterium]
MTSLKARRLIAAFAVLVTVCLPASAGAAPGGISLSPFEKSLSLNPGDSSQSFNLSLTNHTSSLQELTLSVRDFGTLNNTGGIILEGSNPYTQKYGLSAWLSLEKDVVDLNPGETSQVLITVNNQSSLTPGGHYGAIIASVNSLNQAADNNVVLKQQLVSLVLVNKRGGEHYNLKLTSVSHSGGWFSLPKNVRLTFQNPGNVQVVPRGVVKLVSPAGTVIAQGIINTGSAFVLPETFRQLDVPLTKIRSSLPWPGLYHLEVDYRYDGITNFAVNTYRLRFINLGLYLVLAVILSILWLCRRPILRWFKTHANPR